jgi:hypothetical protein
MQPPVPYSTTAQAGPVDQVVWTLMAQRDMAGLQALGSMHPEGLKVRGRSLMGWAAAYHWPEGVQALLDDGESPDELDTLGASPLFLALGARVSSMMRPTGTLSEPHDCVRTVETLLQGGASVVRAWTAPGFQTPIPMGLLHSVFDELTAQSRQRLFGLGEKVPKRAPAALVALWEHSPAMAGRLWDELPASHQLALASSSALQKAAAASLPLTERLLAAGAKPESSWAVRKAPSAENTWLGRALEQNDLSVARRLLEAGAYARAERSLAWTLGAEMAIAQPDMVPLLVQQGWSCAEPWQAECVLQAWLAPPYRHKDGRHPARMPWTKNHQGGRRVRDFPEVLNDAVALGVPLNQPLMLDLQGQGAYPVSRTLLDHGLRESWLTHETEEAPREALLQRFMAGGVTPAAVPELIEEAPAPWVSVLVRQGWQPDWTNAQGQTALHHASERQKVERMLALLEAGANLEVVDKYGHMPFHSWIPSMWETLVSQATSKRQLVALGELARNFEKHCLYPPGHHKGLMFSAAIREAAQKNHMDTLALLDAVVSKDAKAEGLAAAAAAGHMDGVRWLMPRCDPTWLRSKAIAEAAGAGQLACVQLLLPVSEVQKRGCEALMNAAGKGHWECMEVLRPSCSAEQVVDALKMAVNAKKTRCVEGLIPHVDINYLVHLAISSQNPLSSSVTLVNGIARYLNEAQQDTLLGVLTPDHIPEVAQCARERLRRQLQEASDERRPGSPAAPRLRL